MSEDKDKDKKVVTLRSRVSAEGANPPPNSVDPDEPNTYKIVFRDNQFVQRTGYLVVTDKVVTIFKSYGNITFYAPSELIRYVDVVEPSEVKVVH